MVIIVFLMNFIFLAMTMIPFQYEKMVVHKKFCKVKNEVTFSFVDPLLYTITSYYLIENYLFSMYSFPYLNLYYIHSSNNLEILHNN